MHRTLTITVIFACAVWAWTVDLARAGENPTPDKPATAAKPKGIHHFPNDPNVWVNRETKQVFIKAQFSPDLTTVYSPLEFLLISGVYNQKEKTWFYEKGYESAFITKATPQNIHLALLLAGLQPGPLAQAVPKGLSKGTMGGEFGGNLPKKKEVKNKQHNAPMLDIAVQWQEGQKQHSERIEHFLFDRETKNKAASTPWAFTGSFIFTTDAGKKMLASSSSRIVAGVFFDETAIINLPFFTLNPQSSAGGLEINAFYLPPSFTKEKEIVEGHTHRKIKIPVHPKVTLVISPSKFKAPDPNKMFKKQPKKAEKEKPAPKTTP